MIEGHPSSDETFPGLGVPVGRHGPLHGLEHRGRFVGFEDEARALRPGRVDHRVGQTADINFSAFKRRETKRILGRLINLSADSIVDENDPEQRPYYQAIVEITREGLQQLADHDLTLIAGMPAEVFIKTGEKTLLQYLADPLVDTVARSFIED